MDPDYRIIAGDCRASLRTMPSCSVQCVVTSPPYFGLRDYGVAGQLGLEASLDEYLANMVKVFSEVRRVLRDDGTLWLNIGDSWANDGKWGGHTGGKHARALHGSPIGRTKRYSGMKPKDMMGVPWRVAFALQEDGWYLRQDIIWHKPNPMTESVRDRCTKSHEYLFLFSKARRYYYNADAIAEPSTMSSVARLSQPNLANQRGSFRVPGKTNGPMKAVGHLPGNRSHKGTSAYNAGDVHMRTKGGLVDYAARVRDDPSLMMMRNRRSVWTIATVPYDGAHFATFPPALVEPCILAGTVPLGSMEPDEIIESPTGTGRRDEDPSLETGRAGLNRPRREDDGSRPMTRSQQAAYAAQLKASTHLAAMTEEVGKSTMRHYLRTDRSGARAIPDATLEAWIGRGWLSHAEPSPVPADRSRSVVLDPFLGSGTTLAVAVKHGRAGIGLELSDEYIDLARTRIEAMRAEYPLFMPHTRELFDAPRGA